jgi:predicted O-methyltransferase YrrM
MFSTIKNFILKDIILAVKDIRSMSHLNQLYNQYLPWTGATVRPTAMRYILNDIMINDRDIIVECGAGLSSVYIASLLKQLENKDKKLYSIDHDENWLSILQRELDQNSLSEYATLIHAPLTPCREYINDQLEWYDTSRIQELLPDSRVDLLFVDGPPANKKGLELSRYPALPCLKNKLSDNFLVILDDADRKGEETIASKWGEEFGIHFRRSILSGNIYIGVKGDSYNVL